MDTGQQTAPGQAIRVRVPPRVAPAARPLDASGKPKPQPRYHVILLNDEDHTYAYVIRMLGELFAHPPERAYALAKEVDTAGRCIVLTTHLEHAELKRDQIHAYGPDPILASSQGAMSAKLEPTE